MQLNENLFLFYLFLLLFLLISPQFFLNLSDFVEWHQSIQGPVLVIESPDPQILVVFPNSIGSLGLPRPRYYPDPKLNSTRIDPPESTMDPFLSWAKEAHWSMGGLSRASVRGLDLNRYMGRWYEIACFPSQFQPKNGANTRATYTLNPDGTVKVLNETWTDGKRGYIEGTAYKADPSSDEAKLKVRFYVPPFLPIIPITGDYWVLYVGDDYQHAVVGQPSRKYLWILSRNPIIDDDVYNFLQEKAKENGYDVSKLKRTLQSESIPEADEAPNDKGIWWIKSLFGK